MFLNEDIRQAYEDAPRFDESRIFASKEYSSFTAKQMKLFNELYRRLSAEDFRLVQKYLELSYDDCEFECIHFFEQGWLMGQAKQNRERN